jgi:hypothetical protein
MPLVYTSVSSVFGVPVQRKQMLKPRQISPAMDFVMFMCYLLITKAYSRLSFHSLFGNAFHTPFSMVLPFTVDLMT